MKKVWLGVIMMLAVALGMNGVVLTGSVDAATDTKKATKTTYVTKKSCTDGSTNKSKATVKDGKCSGGKYDGSVIVTRVTLSQCGGKSKTKNKKGEECAEGRYVGAKIVATGTKISSKVCTNNGGTVAKNANKDTYKCTGGTLNGFAISQAATKNNSSSGGSSSSGSKSTQSLTYKAESGGGSGIASFGTSTTGAGEAYTMVQNAGGNDDELMPNVQRIINVVIGAVGLVAVVMVIIGGISFATSQGDTAKVAKARNTILYGIVGLVVAILAFAIVNFVLRQVFTSPLEYGDEASCSNAGYTWDAKHGECK